MQQAQRALSGLASISAGLGVAAWALSESLYNGAMVFASATGRGDGGWEWTGAVALPWLAPQ